MSDDPDDEPLSDLADELSDSPDEPDDRDRDDTTPSDDSTSPTASDSPSPPGDSRPSPFDEPGPDSPGEPAPLSDLADEVATRRDADPEDVEDAFDEMDTPEIDAEQLWERLAAGDEALAFSTRVEGEVDRDVRVIPKRTCERCPHFADPPDVGCTHDGTDILELVDVEHHKVADCPMVMDDEIIQAGFDGDL